MGNSLMELSTGFSIHKDIAHVHEFALFVGAPATVVPPFANRGALFCLSRREELLLVGLLRPRLLIRLAVANHEEVGALRWLRSGRCLHAMLRFAKDEYVAIGLPNGGLVTKYAHESRAHGPTIDSAN